MKRLSHLSPVASIVVVLMIEAALAQGPGDRHWAKQLTVGTGWMANGDRVFLTTDGGRAWKDVTPPPVPKMTTPYGISAVFFIDNSTGWVVMHSDYEEGKTKEGSYNSGTERFFIASTNDAGADWSYRRVSTPQIDHAGLEDSHGLSENASLWFTDAQHGIMNIGIAVGSGPGVYPALIVATSDGGKTWKDIESASAGEMVFTTQNDGWIEGPDGLFVTHDGAKTWKEVALPQPEKAEHDPVYLKGSLPMFPDKDHGFMVAEYRRAGDIGTTVLFSSHDGGHTWKPDKVLPRSPDPDSHTVFTILDLEWRTLALRDHKLVLSSPFASSPLASATVDANLAYVLDVVFLDSFHGWVTVGAEFGPTQLLSTSDAGARWTIITPPPIKGDFVEHPPHLKTGPGIWKRPTS
jgi:photosystem II stability/assembly factor-like uncharacterized protein